MTATLTTRNASLDQLVEMLKQGEVRKHDMVVPASKITSRDGMLCIDGAEPVLTEDGVTIADGQYQPTAVFDEGLATKLDIPRGYLRRLRENRPDMLDANLNGWLRGSISEPFVGDPDRRKFLIRTFKGDDGQPGIARAFLSDTYRMIDNLDVLMSTLDGVREAGVKVNIDGGDITERRMRLRITAPSVKALAPVLLKGYRSPFTGEYGSDNPTMFAGFEVSNSEVGGGAFSIVPRLVVQVCSNGMQVTKDALRNVHLGSRMEEGVINWSQETREANLRLIKSQTADAVRTFLDVDYMTEAIEKMQAGAEEEVSTIDEVKDITKPFGFTETEMDSVLKFFISGGQTTAGGVSNAITATAKTLLDGDRAAEFEAAGVAVLL